MSMDIESNYRDEQVAAEPETAFEAQITGRLKDVHTMLPGIIDSFDEDTQTARVQPAIKRIFSERGPVNLPLCVDVPVCFPGGGGMFLTFPVAPGDECCLHFSERCIDFWFDQGGVQLPAEYRMHDYSDAFAVVGVNSKPNVLGGFQTDAVELRNRARTVRVTMKADGTIENANSAGSTILSPAGKLTINAPGGLEINANITHTGTITSNGKNVGSTHTHGGVVPGGGTSGPPV